MYLLIMYISVRFQVPQFMTTFKSHKALFASTSELVSRSPECGPDHILEQAEYGFNMRHTIAQRYGKK